MKSIQLFFVFLISYNISSQQIQLLSDFEVNGIDKTFVNWNGTLSSTTIDNPSPDAVNSSEKVGKLTMVEDLVSVAGLPKIDGYYDAENNSAVTMKIWTPVEIKVNIKLENNPDWGGHNTIATTAVTQTNQWVEVTLNFVTNDILLNKFGIFFSGENNAIGNTYYIDDVTAPNLYTENQLRYFPSDGKANVSKNTELKIYSNTGLVKIDNTELTNDDLISSIIFKENNASGTNVTFTATINNDKNEIVISSNDGLTNDTTYYLSIDHTMVAYNDASNLVPSSSTFITEPFLVNQMLIDFESDETDASWSSWGGAGFKKIENPDKSGINTSNHVGKYTVPSGDAGIENGDVNGSKLSFFDYSVTPYFRVKVWAPKPVKVRMQLQNDPNYGQNSGEKEIYVTDINQWVELIYNFSTTTATNHNRVQLYFDRTHGGSSTGDIYYFDDIHKGDTPPSASSTVVQDGLTDLEVYTALSITGSLAYVNNDGSEIADSNNNVELRLGQSSGEIVPSRAILSDDKLTFTIVPNEMLLPNNTYWYGIKENSTSYVGGASVSGVNGTFTTSATVPTFAIYDDNEPGGAEEYVVKDTLGDPPPNFSIVNDPTDDSNNVLKWEKNSSWGGWNRISYELNNFIDFNKDDVFSIRVLSPETTYVRFKVGSIKGDGNNTSFETDDNILFANQWQTLYFKLSSVPDDQPDYKFISIYINGGNGTPNTFFIDDLAGPPFIGSTASYSHFSDREIIMYPNPTSDYIYFKGVASNETIKIIDLSGKTILEEDVINDILYVGDLSSGIYLILINNSYQKLVID